MSTTKERNWHCSCNDEEESQRSQKILFEICQQLDADRSNAEESSSSSSELETEQNDKEENFSDLFHALATDHGETGAKTAEYEEFFCVEGAGV